MRMPFGKHRGQPVESLPCDYLLWLATIDLRSPLLEAVTNELHRRERPSTAPMAPRPPGDRLADVIQAWYRHLAMKYHPDRGGSNAAMAAVTDGHEALVTLLRQEGFLL